MDSIKDRFARISAVLFFFITVTACTLHAGTNTDQPVTISDNENSYTLANGIIEVIISKASGGIISIKHLGKEVLAGRGERPSAVWSHDAQSPNIIRKITIDPSTNDGLRGEVSIKGISGGLPMGSGPGGSFIADIEIRYCLEKGASGIYTYCVFDHLPDYPASSMGEARFVAFLQKDFDWISIDEKRNRLYTLEPGGLDLSKYGFTAVQHENPAFGWVNTKSHNGFWLINASMEYMSGGPTKVDFLCHRDTKINGAPCVLNYWRSSHYGGSIVQVDKGEKWAKIIGPIFLYCNTGDNVDGVRKNALATSISERAKWPYQWVNSSEYPLKDQRANVSGKLILKDPLTASFTRLRVGLTAPDYDVSQTGTTAMRTVDWQYDAKHYQFWTTGNTKGEFIIKGIRPGNYTLHAIADGVLDEYIKLNITVEPGKNIDLGSLEWKPLRYGKQVWDIGIANRNGAEFLGGDRFFENDILKKYPAYFPKDVNYAVDKSDYHKDWFFVQPPHVENPESPEANAMPEASRQSLAKALGIDGLQPEAKQVMTKTIEDLGRSGKYATGRSTSWSIQFFLTDTLTGPATLRLAICGTGTQSVGINVNEKSAGSISGLRIDGTPNRSGSAGIWYERKITLDTSLFQKGNNTIKLTIPGGQVVNGIMYDYIRLEAGK
jgi:rhamnogalacturonan endolyase